MERDGLKLALRAIADQHHRFAIGSCHPFRGKRRHRGGTKRRRYR